MTTKAITFKNYRYESTEALEATLDDLMEMPVSECTEDHEELADAITDELAGRELEQSLPAHDDSLEDRGIFLGSYAS